MSLFKKLLLFFVLFLFANISNARDIISGKNVDIYYDDASCKYLAQQTVVFADSIVESVFFRLGSQNLITKNKIPIFVYGNAPDFRRTLLSLYPVEEGVMGFTNTYRGQVALFYPGSWDVWSHVLSHELTHAIMLKVQYKAYLDAKKPKKTKKNIKSYTFGKEPPGSIVELDQNYMGVFYEDGLSTTGNLPLWFIEGLAEYMSQTDSDVDFYLRDAFKYDYITNLHTLDDSPDYINTYKSGESAVGMLVSKFGESVLGEIVHNSFIGTFSENLYASAKFKSKANAYKELALEWSSYLKEKYTPALRTLTIDSLGKSIYKKVNWAPTTYGTQTVFYTVTHQQIVLHDGKRILKGDRSEACPSLHIMEKGAFLYGTTLFFVKGKNYDELWSLNTISKESQLLFKSNEVASLTSPYYANGVLAVVAKLKDGKSAIILNNMTFYLNGDIQSVALSPDGKVLAFSGDFEVKGQYYIYLIELQSFKIAKINGTFGAYDIQMDKYGKDLLSFLKKDNSSTKLCFVDFDSLQLKISEPIFNLLFFQEQVYGGNIITTAFNGGTYTSYVINPNKLKYTVDSLTITSVPIQSSHNASTLDIKPVKAKNNWCIDIGTINGGYSGLFGALGSIQACLKALDGSKEIYFLLTQDAFGIMYTKKSMFKDYAIASYTYSSYMWRSIDVIHENTVAIFGGLSYRPTYFTRYSATLTLQFRHREQSWRLSRGLYDRVFFSLKPGPSRATLYTGFRNVHESGFNNFLNFDPVYAKDNKGFISTANLAYIHDDSRYGEFWMPLAGHRLFLMSIFDYDFTNNKIPELTLLGEATKYIYIKETLSLAFRLAGGTSFGAFPYLFELGGPLSVRGYGWGAIVGQDYLFGNAEVRIPVAIFGGLAGLFGDNQTWLGIHHLKFRIFADAGKVWRQWSDIDSRFYMSHGFGLGAFFTNIPINFDWIKTKDREGFRPILSLSYDF